MKAACAPHTDTLSSSQSCTHTCGIAPHPHTLTHAPPTHALTLKLTILYTPAASHPILTPSHPPTHTDTLPHTHLLHPHPRTGEQNPRAAPSRSLSPAHKPRPQPPAAPQHDRRCWAAPLLASGQTDTDTWPSRQRCRKLGDQCRFLCFRSPP